MEVEMMGERDGDLTALECIAGGSVVTKLPTVGGGFHSWDCGLFPWGKAKWKYGKFILALLPGKLMDRGSLVMLYVHGVTKSVEHDWNETIRWGL